MNKYEKEELHHIRKVIQKETHTKEYILERIDLILKGAFATRFYRG